MLEKVRKFILEKDLIKKGDKIIVGLSGGADSVCLLVTLQELFKGDITLLAIHVNHGIRGEEAKRDEDFVREVCKRREVELLVLKADVLKLAKERGLSLEEAGREARYRAFYEEKEKRGFHKIAVAHNKEDVIETFFLNLARGSALSGLTGIKEKNGVIIRPLLQTGREEILNLLKEWKEAYVTDSTNLESDYTRNIIRHELLPILTERVNEKAISHIQESIFFLREADEFIKKEAERNKAVYITKNKDCLYIDNKVLSLPELLCKEILYEAFAEVSGSKKDIGFLHVKLMLGLFQKEVGKQLDLPYLVVAKRTYEGISLSKKRKTESFSEKMPEMDMEIIEIGGIERIRKEGYNIFITLSEGEEKKLSQNGCVRWFDYDRITENLRLRTRKEGDFLRISEDGRKKKLKAYLIDEKVPREERDYLPLLAMGDEILWVLGGRMGEGARLSLSTKTLLKVSIKNMEEEIHECTN